MGKGWRPPTFRERIIGIFVLLAGIYFVLIFFDLFSLPFVFGNQQIAKLILLLAGLLLIMAALHLVGFFRGPGVITTSDSSVWHQPRKRRK